MTARELAIQIRAKKFGKGYRARCPVHSNRPDTISIKQGERWVLVTCFAGCTVEELVKHWGLRVSDLAVGPASPEVRARTSLHEQRERLEKQLGLAIVLQVVEPRKGRYWAAAERNIRRDLQLVRCRLEPLEVYREWRGLVWQRMSAKSKERVLEQAYEFYTATNGTR